MPEPRHPKQSAASRDIERPLYRLPLVLDTDDLCRALRVSAPTVRALIATGRLHRVDYSKSRILVWREEVNNFLQRQTAKPPAAEGLTGDSTPPAPWRDAEPDDAK
jgi:hypothetical protein